VVAIRMSSIYIKSMPGYLSFKGRNRQSIIFWNVGGELVKPKYMTCHRNVTLPGLSPYVGTGVAGQVVSRRAVGRQGASGSIT
jgi:hypothetical protein